MNRRHLFTLLGASALSPLVPKLPEGVPMTVVRETVYEGFYSLGPTFDFVTRYRAIPTCVIDQLAAEESRIV